MKNLILDTSAFIQGFDANIPEVKLYTTPQVLKEIHDDIAKIRASNWSQTGKLTVKIPKRASIKYIIEQATRMGEAKALSEADQSILALTYQIVRQGEEAIIISDDYSVQNIAEELELKYTGMNTKGIKQIFHWITICPGCRKQFNQSQIDNICPICGTELKRKPGKKSILRN